MKKSTKQNLFLLLIVALLATTVFVLKKQDAQNKELRLPINTNNLQSIEIHHSSNIKLEKKNDEWLVTSPKQGKANPKRVEKILTHLKLPLEGGFDATSTDLKVYGLDQPTMTIKLEGKDLDFGTLNTMRQMHYIEYDGKIYLARPFLQVSFDTSLNDLLMSDTSDKE